MEREHAYLRAARGYESQEPREMPYPIGKAEIELTDSFECKMDSDGRVRIKSMNGVPLMPDVEHWLLAFFQDTFRAAMVAELEKGSDVD